MKTYGIIMAGGGGTRFWPLSTKAEPKQFLNLSGKDILVNETIDRQKGFVKQEDIFVVTNETQVPLLLQRTGGRIRPDHVLAEPAARNTAACIGYAAVTLLKKYGDPGDAGSGPHGAGDGCAGDHWDPAGLCLYRLWIYQKLRVGRKDIPQGGGVCRKTGR